MTNFKTKKKMKEKASHNKDLSKFMNKMIANLSQAVEEIETK